MPPFPPAAAPLPTRQPLGARTLGAFAVAAMASHLPALVNGLPLDDDFILRNPALQSLGRLPQVLASPWWYTTNRLYRPLTLATFALERAAGGGAPWLPHAVNLALHGAVVVLFARVLARLVPAGAAIAGALLFALLPVHTEAVASVVGRAELLSAFWMLALLLLVTRTEAPGRRERLLAALLGAAALASKEGGVVAPALAFAAALTVPAQRRFAMRWACSAAVGTLALLAARVAVLGTVGGDLANPAFRLLSAGERIRVALTIVPRAAIAMLLPFAPPIDYVPTLAELHHPSSLLLASGAACALLLLAGVAWHLWRPSAAGLGAWMAAAGAAPTANLLFASGVVLSGRTLYAPALGAAVLVAVVVSRTEMLRASRVPRLAFVVLLVACGTRSWTESSVWRSNDSVIAAMQARHPGDYRSYLHLAYTARDAGHPAEAVTHFREAAARFPGDPEMLTDAATVALALRDTTTARVWLTRAVVVHPGAVRARTRLAGVLVRGGDSAEARRLLLDGLSRQPRQPVWGRMLAALESARAHRNEEEPRNVDGPARVAAPSASSR